MIVLRIQDGWERADDVTWVDERGDSFSVWQVKAAVRLMDELARQGRLQALGLTDEETARFRREVGNPSLARLVRFRNLYESMSEDEVQQFISFPG